MADYVKANALGQLKGAENYKVWRIQIEPILKGAPLTRYYDGHKPKPTTRERDETESAFEAREDA
ncbi:hypothetical protein LTR91_022439 [Friedmanniomyces endolithicus]|uniref:Retrotransposon Copia-like N-terminal domain-containing protein n=1 Tax=Friedmanniomyces endolithicus TaxID=329885 RepID=A0AAN6JYN6_9PEZI|nr:hypothetical protein LTR94_016776 [Friedmanniomyces endolithicus]KAK0776133.1 hypothetical protein LTR38_015619 [Friedmanniomyces endolithicus]KAK0776985.1 hypothetical protein LTR59_014014 [Friedmanniomyces endolithicus]KAK0787306.1 hypothetical protein LTR75_012932 [Friedmanniomyces endolithicus]KAK0831767.1 hypothetical protein LTR03_015473 [Friedmanniomyces endolithicus]